MKIPLRQTVFGAVCTTAILALGVPSGGWAAVEGLALGLAVAGLSVVALTLVVNMLAANQPNPRQGTATVLLTNLLKFPVMLAGIYFATRLPMVGIYCFLAAIALVYFSTVWLTVERSKSPQPEQQSP